MKQIPAEFWNFPTTSHGVALEHVARVCEVEERPTPKLGKGMAPSFFFQFEMVSGHTFTVVLGDDKERALRLRNAAVEALTKYHLFKELLKACRFHFEPPAE